MPNISIQIDSQQIDTALAQLMANTNNLSPALSDIGDSVEGLIGLLFRDTQTPEGVLWPGLSSVTKSRRRKGSDKPLTAAQAA